MKVRKVDDRFGISRGRHGLKCYLEGEPKPRDNQP